MKFIKVYESFGEFDMDFVISKIKEQFSEEEVAEKFDMEILEWVDSDWEEDYESEYDWYIDHNNGEAQDVVIGELINWYVKEFGDINLDNKSDLYDALRDEYGI